jgi:hypothetical protein
MVAMSYFMELVTVVVSHFMMSTAAAGGHGTENAGPTRGLYRRSE